MKPHLGIIIPAFNEEERIGPTLARVSEYFASANYTYTVVVISDGSSDKTEELVQVVADGDSRIKLIASHPNHGKGFVVRRGMLEVDAEWLLFCDADLATPIEEIEKLWTDLEKSGAPIAIGSRPLKESQLEIRQPWYREMLGRCFNFAVQTLGIRGIADTQCGFKMFRQDVALDVFSRCKIDGFGFDFEALMVAKDLGYQIVETPIRWQHKEGSKVVLMRDGPRMLKELVALRMAGKNKRIQKRES